MVNARQIIPEETIFIYSANIKFKNIIIQIQIIIRINYEIFSDTT